MYEFRSIGHFSSQMTGSSDIISVCGSNPNGFQVMKVRFLPVQSIMVLKQEMLSGVGFYVVVFLE